MNQPVWSAGEKSISMAGDRRSSPGQRRACVCERDGPVKYDPGCLGSIHFQPRLLMAPCPPIISLNDSEVITYLILTSGIDWLTGRWMMDRWVARQTDGQTDGRMDRLLKRELISLIPYVSHIWLDGVSYHVRKNVFHKRFICISWCILLEKLCLLGRTRLSFCSFSLFLLWLCQGSRDEVLEYVFVFLCVLLTR